MDISIEEDSRPSISDRRIEWSCYEDNKEDRKLLEMELPRDIRTGKIKLVDCKKQ